MSRFIALLLIVGLAVCSHATVISVPADQSAIQEGVDAAVSGDTVLIDHLFISLSPLPEYP